MPSFIKARSERSNGAIYSDGTDVGDLLAALPCLKEYLTVDRWEDGQPRQVATLLLFLEDGLWKVCLNDRSESRSAWASGHTPEGALQSLDRSLTEGTQEWRRSGSRKQGR